MLQHFDFFFENGEHNICFKKNWACRTPLLVKGTDEALNAEETTAVLLFSKKNNFMISSNI